MKTFYLSISAVMLMMLFMSSCDKTQKPDEKPKLDLTGEWKLEKMDFIEGVEEWPADLEYGPANGFQWAPLMFSGMTGFDFTDDKFTANNGKEGTIFQFISSSSYTKDKAKKFWFWALSEDGKSFSIDQINKAMPPYDFSITNVTDLKVAEDKGVTVCSFTGTVTSRIIGKSMGNLQNAKVKIEMSKSPVTSETVTVLIKGKKFEIPEVQKPKTFKEQLMDTKWKLKPGSEIYDPGFSAAKTELLYRQLICFSIEKEAFNFRYIFPAGVVSTKKAISYSIEKDLLTYVKEAVKGPMGNSPEITFEWKIKSVDLKSGKLVLEELKSKEEREFVKVDDIEKGIDKEEYKTVKE